MKFLALNIDFSNPRPDPVSSRKPAHTSGKEGYPLKSDYLSTVGLFGMKMIAERQRHAAYHNKHW